VAEVLVIGSGFAGLSAAARLAKLRHRVTVLEASAEPGGLLLGREFAGQRWTTGPQSVTLPGVFRDLFRKSGRPMDALISISTAPPRRHLLPGRFGRSPIEFDLPFGTRGAQHDAVVGAFGKDHWSDWVDGLADEWNTLRRAVLEPVQSELSPATKAALGGTRTVKEQTKRLGRRLAPVAADLPGVGPQDQSVATVIHYVERNFGRWEFAGGLPGLAAALLNRLTERRVQIETGVHVAEVLVRQGRAHGVRTTDGTTRAADIVIWATGDRTETAELAAIESPDLSLTTDLVAHLKPAVHLWRSGPSRWLLSSPLGTDPVALATRAGLELSTATINRLPHSTQPRNPQLRTGAPADRWSSMAIETTPGLWLIGGAAVTGAGLEWTGMGTAALAGAIGSAPR